MSNWIVAKFGGTSMATIGSMTQCAEVINIRNANIVLVSATSGTTNQLVELTELAKQGDLEQAEATIEYIENRHRDMLAQTTPSTESVNRLNDIINELKTLVNGCVLVRNCSANAYDAIVSIGEMLSSTIFASLCEDKFSRVSYWLDVRQIIKTDSQHMKARPDIAAINQCSESIFIDPGTLYISQGFIGSDANGITTTLGRGGSDYSAALVAEGIRASELQIWTDVPGMASTDPRLCDDARSIPAISIKEASEMATFGAKILHPSSLMPAVRHDIPVFVGSTFNPELAGTTITPDVEDRPIVRAVTKRSNQLLLSINNPDMLTASGFLQRVFATFEAYEISVDAITTSEISIAVTIDESEFPAGDLGSKFLTELEEHGRVKVERDMALVAIVGNELYRTPGIGARIFDAVKDINVRMITQGASNHNFCLVVSDQDSNQAVKQLHQELIIES